MSILFRPSQVHSSGLLALLLLPACVLAPKDAPGNDSALGGNGADYCAETGRTTITDASVAADGFDYAPQDVITNFAHGWGGTWAVYSGGSTAASASLTWTDGAISAATYAMSGGGDSGTMGSGAGSADCPPRYEIIVAYTVNTDDGLLAEAGETTLVASAVDAASFHVSIPLAQVAGTTSPADWNPADWASNTLALDGSGDPSSLMISATWQASSTAAGPVEDSGGSSGTDTGTVSPSGITAGLGSMTLTPDG